jgi:transcriptional regulator with XRE-family HTH domain
LTGYELSRLRSKLGLTQTKFAELIAGPLGRKYSGNSIGKWENEGNPIPEPVAAYLESLAMELELTGQIPIIEPLDDPVFVSEDTAPGGGSGPVLAVDLSGRYERICTELFELVATGTGMVGAAMGNDKVMKDGLIIHNDRVELGKAYAKLAETNETFRRMLGGVTSGGAVLQVCLVTGTTVGAIWRNHQPTPQEREEERLHVVREPEPVAVS